jgi:hypothetical protein
MLMAGTTWGARGEHGGAAAGVGSLAGISMQQGGGRVLVGVGYVDWLCHGPMLDWIRNVCTIAMKSFAVALDGDLEVART